MVKFVRGDVVVIPFPFSDLSQAKRRPALVVASLKGDDLILCQITSRNISDEYAVSCDNSDITGGSLDKCSNVRPNRLFTADRHIVLYKVGTLSIDKLKEVVDSIVDMIQQK